MHKVILYFFPLSCSSAHFIRLSSSYQAFTFTSFLHHTSVLLVCVFPQLLSHLSPSLYQTFTAFPITNTSFILDLPRLYQGFPPPSSLSYFLWIYFIHGLLICSLCCYLRSLCHSLYLSTFHSITTTVEEDVPLLPFSSIHTTSSFFIL